jgi:hypothetical protein
MILICKVPLGIFQRERSYNSKKYVSEAVKKNKWGVFSGESQKCRKNAYSKFADNLQALV